MFGGERLLALPYITKFLNRTDIFYKAYGWGVSL